MFSLCVAGRMYDSWCQRQLDIDLCLSGCIQNMYEQTNIIRYATYALSHFVLASFKVLDRLTGRRAQGMQHKFWMFHLEVGEDYLCIACYARTYLDRSLYRMVIKDCGGVGLSSYTSS